MVFLEAYIKNKKSSSLYFFGADCQRIDHLLLLEENLSNPYSHKIRNYLVKSLVI